MRAPRFNRDQRATFWYMTRIADLRKLLYYSQIKLTDLYRASPIDSNALANEKAFIENTVAEIRRLENRAFELEFELDAVQNWS